MIPVTIDLNSFVYVTRVMGDPNPKFNLYAYGSNNWGLQCVKSSEDSSSKDWVIEKINAFVQEFRPFIVLDGTSMNWSLELDGHGVIWKDSDIPTRQAIVEKYVLAKLRTFGQEEQPPLQPIDVDGLAKLIDYEAGANDPRLQLKADVQDRPALPFTSQLINKLLERKETEGVRFFSCAARGECLWAVITNLFYAVLAPLIFVCLAFCGDDEWRNWGWRVLDTAMAMPLSPLVYAAKAIQNLLGAFIHPAIALVEY